MIDQILHEHWPVRLTEVFYDLGSGNVITEVSLGSIRWAGQYNSW